MMQRPASELELRMVELASRGFSNAEIAADVGMKTESVKVALTRIGQQLGVRKRAGLTRWYIENHEKRGDCDTCILYQAHRCGVPKEPAA